MWKAGSGLPKVAVIGAGPAGMSCALWLKHLGLQPRLIDNAPRVGGMQNLNFLCNDWVLGQPDVTGPQLVERFQDHIARLKIEPDLAVEQLHISREGTHFVLHTASSTDRCSAVVLATGTRYRAQEVLEHVAGVDALDTSHLRYGPHAFAPADDIAGRSFLIIGGGDNALENARVILGNGGKVILAARSSFRAQHWMMDAVKAMPGCEMLSDTRLTSVRLHREVVHASLDVAGRAHKVAVDRIHVLTGYEPNTACLRHLLATDIEVELDEQNYVRVDVAQRTSAAGIYAAGDVCNPRFPNVVSALSQGAQAAKTIEADLLR